MKQLKKWCERTDPFSIKFKYFKLIKVLGYPHAGNDVFYCKGLTAGKKVFCFFKVARQKDNNTKNEIQILKKLKHMHLPKLLSMMRKILLTSSQRRCLENDYLLLLTIIMSISQKNICLN